MPLDGLKQDANTKKSSGRSDSLISFIWMWRIKKKKKEMVKKQSTVQR